MSEGQVEDKSESSILDGLAHSDTVRKLVECPVCLDLPLPPIYVCNKGHIVCNQCQARTYACPLCREHYSTTRAFVAEGLIEKCILRCKHSDHGCPLSMRGSEMVDHLEVCDYRPVKCVDCSGKLINFNEYEDHLLKYHKINGIFLSRAYVIYSMNLAHQMAFGEKCCWPQYYLKPFDNVTFLLRLYATHWFVCAWVSLLGPKTDCVKYEALLEFQPNKDDDSVVHTWRGPVNHFRADQAKDIFLQGRGLITPMETLMQMAPVTNDHAEWLYNIEILEVSNQPNEESPEADDARVQESTEDTPQASAETGKEEGSPEEPISGCPIPSARQLPAPEGGISARTTRMSQTPARLGCESPQQRNRSTYQTPRRSNAATVGNPGPPTISPSTSVLGVSATITSVLPTSRSIDSLNNQAESSFALNNSDSSSRSRVTVSTATTRWLNSCRRQSPFSFLFQRDRLPSDDYWNYATESEGDDEE